jgi:hypothetical protein
LDEILHDFSLKDASQVGRDGTNLNHKEDQLNLEGMNTTSQLNSKGVALGQLNLKGILTKYQLNLKGVVVVDHPFLEGILTNDQPNVVT